MSIEQFVSRHIGPREEEIQIMLKKIGYSSLDELIDNTVPKDIRLGEPLNLPDPVSEHEYLLKIKEIATKNKIYKTYIGLGYYNTITPAVIMRNIFENSGWYTSYTPYQAEISQGRLEALLNFQTVIMDLTGMEIANASLLDESTAASEAMIMLFNSRSKTRNEANVFFVDENVFPQTLDVLATRSLPLGIELLIGDYKTFQFNERIFGAFLQYPNSDGNIEDYSSFTEKAHVSDISVAVAADILSLALLVPPGEWGADVVVGSTQRFGIPMGFGGPHAAYFATREKFKRSIPGRIIGLSVDVNGNKALRMALQTREQHIKRERATSNICTAQALLATMAGMYAVYHGADGLRSIAQQIHYLAGILAANIEELGYSQHNDNFFDTLKITLPNHINASDIQRKTNARHINFRYIDYKTIGVSLDETTTLADVNEIIEILASTVKKKVDKLMDHPSKLYFAEKFLRKSEFFNLDLFRRYRSESALMRYIKKLERKDYSLADGMISLGSCTMKLNAAAELFSLSWPEIGSIHPFVPDDQAEGYYELMEELELYLKEITGFTAISFQPNSGAAGEYTGLLVIREYHISKDQGNRNIILIPASAHGTNPASAAMAGMKVVIVNCDEKGNIDINHLKQMAEQHKDNLSALMITYPSTHGVFEEGVKQMVDIIHQNGGLVYMDGANMNAQVGLTNPATIGADVCHLNLHKTFAIPHGGGGPGVGSIAVSELLAEFLPKHPVIRTGGENGITAVSSAPYGSASILTISHAYCKMLGSEGLTRATKIAILNANYLAASLKDYYNVLYTGKNGTVGHEMILDCRQFKSISEVTEIDIAKRLMDYGFHAPTLSFPVHGTLMIEPTESEPLEELNRFIDAMVSIHKEIMEISEGKADRVDNVLKNAPHTAQVVISDKWNHVYERQKAAYPIHSLTDNKYWPTVSRLDDAFGDRNLVCSCKPMYEYE